MMKLINLQDRELITILNTAKAFDEQLPDYEVHPIQKQLSSCIIEIENELEKRHELELRGEKEKIYVLEYLGDAIKVYPKGLTLDEIKEDAKTHYDIKKFQFESGFSSYKRAGDPADYKIVEQGQS